MLDGTLLTMHAHADAEALARAYRVLNGDSVGTALVSHEARLQHRLGATTTAVDVDSLDGTSWADDGQSAKWRSAESVLDKPQMKKGDALGSGNGMGSEDFGFEGEHAVKLHVGGGDDSHRSLSGAFGGLMLGNEEGAAVDMSPAEVLDAAIARSWPDVWDVSEEDVARIFPRAVSHRLRVRDGPEDEVLSSVMWPAVPSEVGSRGATDKQTMDGDEVRLGWERKKIKDILVRILADV